MSDTTELRVAAAPRLGWRAARRPRPGFAHVLGAAAGAFAVVASLAFVVEATSNEPTGPGIAFNAVLAIGALILGFRVPGPVRSACVTAIVLTVPLVWFFALFGNGDFTRDNVRFLYLLIGATYLLLYFTTWTKGRTILLAGALIVFASWATFEVAGSGSNSLVPFQGEIDNSQSTGNLIPENGFGISDTSSTDDTTNATSASALVIGLVFLGIGAVLDRRKLHGAATPFVAVGAFEAIVGAAVLGSNESALAGGLLAIGVGIVVGVIGGRGENRRATTWIGVITVFVGLVVVLIDIAPNSAAGVGAIAVVFALTLGGVAWGLAPLLGEPNDGDDDPVLPPPAPPRGTTDSDDATEPTVSDAAPAESPADEEAAA